MSKTLYEEALTDARQLKEVAEANAKRAIIEAVTPKIKDMIERQLLGESETCLEEDGDLDEADGVSASAGVSPTTGGSEEATGDGSTAGGAEQVPPPGSQNEVFELTSESMDSLMPFSNRVKPVVDDRLELKIYELEEATNELVIANAKTKASAAYIAKINETIQKIEDMYSYVQESIDSSRKSKLENKLERSFSVLTAVKETTMRMKDLVSEANLSEETEVTLKVTGLPDDVELDKLNIDIISDEDEDTGALPEPATSGEPPMGGEKEAAPPMPSEGDMYEDAMPIDEDEVVEISETMLRQEIARMKKLAEAGKVAPVTACGHKMDADILDDFGGGEDEGDAWLDGKVSTHDKDNMVKQGKTSVKEGEELECDELEEKDLIGKMDDDFIEESKRSFANAKKALAIATAKAAVTETKFTDAKAVYAKHKGGKHHAKAYSLAERAYKAHKSAKARVAEATKRVQVAEKVLKESLKNSDSKQLAESKAASESLRKQLVETNLLNAKLIQANKLLQIEGLSVKQKATIIDKLDEAQNLKEVKLVYESLVAAFGGGRKTVAEGANRSAGGSSSRPTRSAGAPPAPLNEGVGAETARWAVLAGLSK